MDVEELIARAEIGEVLARYARSADRADWEQVRSCYHPDALDDHGMYSGGLDGLMNFLRGLSAHLESTFHQLGNCLIEMDGEQARVETYCSGWYRRRDRTGTPVLVGQGLRYLDVFERRDQRWAIAKRVVVLDWEQLFEGGEPPSVAATWARGGRGPQDPSFTHFGR